MPPARILLWVASLGGLALAARSVLLGPVPVGVALGAFAGYVALAVAGVLVPRLEMFADVLWRGSRGSPWVALTFDDGPHPEWTRAVLAVLAEQGVPATFFLIGSKVERHPDVVREIAAAGHDLGAHGWDHDRLYAFLSPGAVAEDVERTRAAIERAASVRPRWFRPPVGQVSPRTAAGARRAGVEIVGWSARGLDGLAGAEPAKVAARIERALGPGAIVMLHDAAERDDREPVAVRALPLVLDAIRRRGLVVKPLDALADARD